MNSLPNSFPDREILEWLADKYFSENCRNWNYIPCTVRYVFVRDSDVQWIMSFKIIASFFFPSSPIQNTYIVVLWLFFFFFSECLSVSLKQTNKKPTNIFPLTLRIQPLYILEYYLIPRHSFAFSVWNKYADIHCGNSWRINFSFS